MPIKSVKAIAAPSAMPADAIVNSVRNAYSNRESTTGINFAERIPVCTQNTLAEIGEIFSNDPNLANAFITELINRIGLVRMNYRRYTNNLKTLKAGRLENGETVEEIAFGLVKGVCDKDVETGVTDVFKITRPEVASALHKVNFQVKYPVSITWMELRKAFTSMTALGSFIDGVITSVYNSYEVDEQLAMKNLITEAAKLNFFQLIELPEPNNEASGKAFVKKVKATANKMQWMNTDYNKYGIPQFSDKSDLVIILTADVDADTEVDVLAAAFQATAVDFVGTGRKIMVDGFGVPGLYAVVVDRRFFQIYDYDFSMDWIYNPSNRVWNGFLHVWEVLSASPFMQGVAFVAPGSGTVTSVTVDPNTATVAKGGTQKFTAAVETEGIADSSVTWAVNGGGAGTAISANGVLTVAADQTAGQLTVTATSVADNTKKGTATVTVE